MAAHDPLRKCPNPECESKPQMARYQCYRVCCEGCGMEGPMALKVNSKNEAARLWNLLPRDDGCHAIDCEECARLKGWITDEVEGAPV